MYEENKIGGGAEHPGSDEQKISQLLSDLKRVEAPKDFDFHLKARIANARPEAIRPARLSPFLKYVLPAALVATTGAAFVLSGSFGGDSSPQLAGVPAPVQSVPPAVAAAAPEPPRTTVAAVSPVDEGPVRSGETVAAVVPKREAKTGSQTDSRRSVGRQPSEREFQPGSREMTVRVAPTPISAPGTAVKTITAGEAMQLIDVDAEIKGGSWSVRSVKANGLADQFGVKAGDVLRAIDGKTLDEKTTFEGGLKVSTIQVRRGEATLDLNAAKPKE